MKIKILAVGLLILVGCGGGISPDGPLSLSVSKGDVGYVQLNVENAKKPSILESVQIEKFKIIIEGEDLAPIEYLVEKEAEGIVIQGIPKGKSRQIHVLALSRSGKTIREGLVKDITIEGGKTLTLSIRLEPTPYVLNFAEEDATSNRRLHFKILSDPGHTITVEEKEQLTDAVTGQREIKADEKGIAKFYPGILAEGTYHFTFRDLNSEKSSSAVIRLWEGAGIGPAPLFSASRPESDRVGQSVARQGGSREQGGGFFPNIAQILWNNR